MEGDSSSTHVDPAQKTQKGDDHACPKCGAKTTKSTFRTGSVDHPPQPTHVCVRCGTRT